MPPKTPLLAALHPTVLAPWRRYGPSFLDDLGPDDPVRACLRKRVLVAGIRETLATLDEQRRKSARKP